MEWVRGLPEYAAGGTYSTAAEAVEGLRQKPADLVMYNRLLPDLVTSRFWVTLQNEAPATRVLGHRIYNSSDGLFYSQPAVSGGYFFRRRSPEALLEPIRNAWQSGSLTPGEWSARICAYVQRLFLFPLESDSGNDASALTSREQDILTCLRSGSTDKEIARALDISAWTVHTHLKKIYEKLGARSRTEAIIKYLQK
jgi:DNA-binding NarL/FixJ family response regulator